MVPCYKTDNGQKIGGMYDKANNSFYPSESNTGFVLNSKPQVYNYGEQKNLTTNTYTRRGYDFVGWNTEPDGTGTSYTDEQQYQNLTKSNQTINLYAQWITNTPTVTLTTGSYNGSTYPSGAAVCEPIYHTITLENDKVVSKYQYSKDSGTTWLDMPATEMDEYNLSENTAKYKISDVIDSAYQVRAVYNNGTYSEVSNSYRINIKEPVYSITNTETAITTYYLDLPTAVAAASNGQTIKLLQEFTDNKTTYIENNITLDLQDKILTRENGIISVKTGGTLTIKATTGGITSTAANTIEVTSGTLNVNTGNITSTNGYGINVNGGTANIGIESDSFSSLNPKISGSTYGIYKASGSWNFYNGILKGGTAAYNGDYSSLRTENTYHIETGVESNDGNEKNYKTAWLSNEASDALHPERYGQFIDYGIDLSSEDEEHIDGWKILYENEEGTYIIAADYVKNNNEALAKAMESNKANMGTNSEYPYSAYWPSSNYYTHTTTGDSTGNAVINSNASKFKFGWTGGGLSNSNMKTTAALLDTDSWSSFLSDGATYAIGAPTLELFRASWNAKTYNDGRTHNKLQLAQESNVGYYIGTSVNTTTQYIGMNTDSAYYDELFYPHRQIWNNHQGYWLAAPSASNKEYTMTVFYQSGIRRDGAASQTVGVRPVVFLPNTVTYSWDDANQIWKIDRDKSWENLDASNYGDYIDYGVDLSSEDENHIDGWKIFYKNDEGTYLIAADYVRNDNIYLQTAMVKSKANMGHYEGYNYSAYWPSASYLTHVDESGNAAIDGNAGTFMYNWNSGGMNQGNKKAVASLLDTNSWSCFLKDGATMAIGTPTLEMYRASWNSKTYRIGSNTKLQIAQNSSKPAGYTIGSNNDDNYSPTSDYVQMSSNTGYNDTLYYPHKNAWNNSDGYWLASPSSYGENALPCINYNGYVGVGNYSSKNIGVRPVVFLPNNITATWNKKDRIWKIDREWIPEDVTLGDNIYDAKEDTTVNTYVSAWNGELIDYNGWNSTDYIDISEYKRLLFVSENPIFLGEYNAVYDSDKNYVRPLKFNRNKVNNDVLGDIEASIAILNVQENDKYIRLSESKNVLKDIKIYPILDDNFTGVLNFNVARDIEFGDNILTDDKIVPRSYIDSTNGKEIAYSTWTSTDYIYVGDTDRIAIAKDTPFSLGGYNALYDENKNYIKNQLFANVKDTQADIGYYTIYEVPSDVSYIRLSASSNDMNGLKIYNVLPDNYVIPFKYMSENLEVGDSILNHSTDVADTYIGKGGNITDYNTWSSTDFIDIGKYKSVFIKNFRTDYSAIYNSSKQAIESLSINSFYLYNDVLGKVGFGLRYLSVTNLDQYIRLSATTGALPNAEILPILNEDFNKYVTCRIPRSIKNMSMRTFSLTYFLSFFTRHISKSNI